MSKRIPDQDRRILSGENQLNWVPPDPAKYVLPYIEAQQEGKIEDGDLEKRKKKTEKVLKDYDKIINQSKKLEKQIEDRCKNVKVRIPEDQADVIDALERVFGLGTREITFEQYKICIRELDKLNKSIDGV